MLKLNHTDVKFTQLSIMLYEPLLVCQLGFSRLYIDAQIDPYGDPD